LSSSSLMPSERYSCFGSPLIFKSGRTAQRGGSDFGPIRRFQPSRTLPDPAAIADLLLLAIVIFEW
jgi:hypothetical protein